MTALTRELSVFIWSVVLINMLSILIISKIMIIKFEPTICFEKNIAQFVWTATIFGGLLDFIVGYLALINFKSDPTRQNYNLAINSIIVVGLILFISLSYFIFNFLYSLEK